MSRKTRRAVLAAAGATLLAGCSGAGDDSDGSQNNLGGAGSGGDEQQTPTPRPDSDGDGVPDGEDDYPNDPDYSAGGELVNDERTIGEDEWYVWEYEFEEEIWLSTEFTVREGPPIDMMWFTESEYSYYEDQERATPVSGGYEMDAAGGANEVTLPAGTYRLVLDNTEWGQAAPPTNFDEDPATVSITVDWKR